MMTEATPLAIAAADALWFPANPQASEPTAILSFKDTLALVGRCLERGRASCHELRGCQRWNPLVGYGQPRMVVDIDPHSAVVFDDRCHTGWRSLRSPSWPSGTAR